MRISRKALEKGAERGDLTPEEGRLLLAHQVSEEDFQADVERLARTVGWLAYHTRRSDRSEPGFYDLFLLHPKRNKLILAELKAQAGRSTPEQKVWADAGAAVALALAEILWTFIPGPPEGRAVPVSERRDDLRRRVEITDPATWPVAYFLWRPYDWPEIERTLT